ncbi:hypothetical protein Poli38472_010701 [Pythium oligandrum]|uniref:Crinkler effector protein N-terminal domain-containing protein n=1 Tax=Pythium oligandrum TaxID=41045 RepID=A0A8K1CEP4_PYTOL|nr:hypothetical protein Poli38472_010701 [Pythium oligandrum]|eukprot:TMW61638.1 hypothetical protein Poli38472_010701 [Pythium oligandrum]
MAGNEAELTCVNIRNGSDFTVDIPWTASIHKMKKLINAELQLTTLPSDLALYLAKPKDSDQWLSPRDPEVRNLRSNVVSDEIQKLLCDELAAGDLVANVVQHAPTSGVTMCLCFWKGYGGFPESYLVRKEEVIFWQVVKSMLKSIDDDNWPRIVLMKNRVAMSTWPKLVKEQHYYSGGSLREFCRERADLVAEVQANCSRVHSDHARDLVFAFGGDQSSRQMDRLRRHYVANPSDPSHYIRNGNWRVAVDSGYALHLLARFVTVAEQAGLYEYAQSVGGGFLGIAYELLLHRAVRQTVLPGSSVIVRMRPNSHYDRIHIDVSSVECRGENEDDCYECIAQLPEATYWHPNYPSFPFIDAVTPCKAYRPGSDESEDVIAYIQVTIQDNKTFKRHRLEQLNEMMDKNTRLSPLNRVYIVVGPNASVCETFTLRDAPRPDTIVAMVGCFDPQPYVERAKLLSLQPSRSVEAVGQV